MMREQKLREIIFNVCIILNALLVFVLLFGAKMELPTFIQAFGRAHPLLLHFPIVLLLLSLVFEMLLTGSNQKEFQKIVDWVLLIAVFTTVVAALMGLFLSKESGYEGDDVVIHKWMGISCSLLSFAWYGLRNLLRKNKIATFGIGISTTIVLLIAGHKGANITHGSDFLLSPIMGSQQPTVLLDDAVIYPHLIKPIIQEKCMSCHNNSKAKGELMMESEQALLKGGKTGKLWDTTAPDLGLMMQRIHLPIENEEHMPPKGKVQLTPEETRVLYLWIKDGASFTKKVTDLPENDSLRMIASTFFQSESTEEVYDFAAIDESTVTGLNTEYLVIAPIAKESPALAVNFYGAPQFKSSQLKDLEKIKDNIVSLHLSEMPLKDDDLKLIGNFINLRYLNLSFTPIKGDGLKHLAGLKHLKQLSLSGTKVTGEKLKVLAQIKSLKSVQVWNTPITESELEATKKSVPNIKFNIGFKADTVVAKLTTPIIETDGDIKIFKDSLSVKIKMPIKGAVTRYTLDGSEPDSLTSPIYKDGITLKSAASLKVKTFLKGWITSNTASMSFYKSNLKPDSIQLITIPTAYATKGGLPLIDNKLGSFNIDSGEWLAYVAGNPFEAYLFFSNGVDISSVTFGTVVDTDRQVFPADELQVWGGNNIKDLKLLNKTNPKQPDSLVARSIFGLDCVFPTEKVKVIKLIAKPIDKLPDWHSAKGNKGWIFFDELLFN